ncbi:MAG: SLBB domain-containing protein [Geminicoccaceae bacterium]
MPTRLICTIFVTLGLLFAQVAWAQETTLAAGDRVLIDLPGETEFEDPFAIDATGRLLLPEIGEVNVSGLSLPEAEARLRDALGVAFRSAQQMELRLVERRLLVRVLGYVEEPGLVDIARGETVQVAISQAGGVRLGAQLDRLQLRRGDEVQSFDYKRYLETGDPRALPELNSLDIIFVPASPLLGNVQVAIDASTFEGSGDADDAGQAVSVFGEVVRPGVYSYRDGMSLLDAILRAGGVTRYAGVEQIRIITGGEPSPFNLKDYLDSGDLSLMPMIAAGTTIFVPNESANVAAGARTVYVMGEVNSPGAYDLSPEANMLDVFANAGGPTRYADPRNIRVLRAGGGTLPFDLTRFAEGDANIDNLPVINPGDAIFVPEAAQDDANSWLTVPPSRAIYIIGAINRPGRYEWSDEMSFLDLLAQAGGPTPTADVGSIEVASPDSDGRFITQSFDLDDFRTGGANLASLPRLRAGTIVTLRDLPQDPTDNTSRYILQPPERSIYVMGAVGAPGRYAYEPGLSLLDVLSAAEGPVTDSDLRRIRLIKGTTPTAETSTIDLSLFFETGDGHVLPELAAGDTIYVPSLDRPFVDQASEDTVRILGAVGTPGRYIFNDEMTVLDLLAQAGGPTSSANNEKIVIVNLSCCRDQARSFDLVEFAETGDVDLLPVVRPGDTIYVPDRDDTAYQRFIDGVVDISRIVGLIALIVALL